MDLEDEDNWLLSSTLISVPDKKQKYIVVDPPICKNCRFENLSYFDPTCYGCREVLSSKKTTVEEVFAIIRQWVPQTQQNINILISELFKRGTTVNDRDPITDMNLMHYVTKSGASGMGDVHLSLKVAKMLINSGILINAKCRWTDMSALHYAVFFDVHLFVTLILDNENFNGIDKRCKEFDNGTALHIACKNLSLKSVQILIKHGFNPHFVDDNGKRPIDCLSDADNLNGDKEFRKIAVLLRNELTLAMKDVDPNTKQDFSNRILQALGLKLHDQVVVSGKIGILRYAGSPKFASGQWGGIEFERPDGKNDGSFGDVRYFKCKPDHGIFAPITKVKKYNPDQVIAPILLSPDSTPRESSPTPENMALFGLKLGEKVIVAGQKTGFVRYRGPTKFASGTWVGVELEDPVGKNDGSVGDFRYFTCDSTRGIFAPLSKVQRICEAIEEDAFADPPKTVRTFKEKKKKDKSRGIEDKKVFMKVDNKRTEHERDDETDSLDEKKKDQTDEKIEEMKTGSRKSDTIFEHLSQPKKHSESRLDKTFGAQVNFTLKTGMSVYVNNEIGIIRFIGRVEFSDGVWLGVELRRPNGKNDGSVEDKRYFTCKPNYGLMVRPSRASCRGINCEQLIDLKFR